MPRLIMYHKQSTSARTRFLRLAYGGVCGFEPLPKLSELAAEDPPTKVATHPAALVRDAEQRLGLPAGGLELESGFRCRVDSAGEATQVFLARFTAIDPPFEVAAAQGGAFIDLTQARGLPPVELQLLRRAYEAILG